MKLIKDNPFKALTSVEHMILNTQIVKMASFSYICVLLILLPTQQSAVEHEESATSFVEKAYEEDVGIPEDYWVETHQDETTPSPQVHRHKMGDTLRPFICLWLVYCTFILLLIYLLSSENVSINYI
ncbi:unnamed protein product [Nezara viridula]|uniref:Uncharacterized protein n=1 Tax=Nezara viridula TaxID=85310 RepID=A0A9P0HKW9_NEZVI|nr:unnamed protein product [Nezara viridula]